LSDNDDNNEEEESEQKNINWSKARIIRSVCFNKEVDSEKHYRELVIHFMDGWNNWFIRKLFFLPRTLFIASLHKLNHHRQTVCQVELGFLCCRILHDQSKPLWHNYGLCARLSAHSRYIVLINF
jgi:hypothetical protein